MNKKILFLVAGILFLAAAVVGYNYYQKIYGKSVLKSGFLFIKSTDQLDELSNSLTDFIQSNDDFLWVAEKKKFTRVKAGKYKLTEGMTNNDLVNLFEKW